MRLHDGRVVHFPAIMGVLNVTPDSFSDGGRYLRPERAIAHALEMQENGADIIDLGGESTRPSGAREVRPEEELRRLLPVLRGLGAAAGSALDRHAQGGGRARGHRARGLDHQRRHGPQLRPCDGAPGGGNQERRGPHAHAWLSRQSHALRALS